MADLVFDISIDRDGFTLDMAETIPLHGITAIKGHSGSGKTTLLRVLSGLEPTARARIEMAGTRIDDTPVEARRIGFVFQDARLFSHMSVAQNLAYGARRRRVAQTRIDDIIQALDLAPLLGRAPAGLSGGEARRVALGRAMASGPQLLLLDEPLSGLDSARRAEILPYIARASDSLGLPVIYVSHAGREVDFLADRLLRMSEGRSLGWEHPPLALPATARRDGQVEVLGQMVNVGHSDPPGTQGEIRPLGQILIADQDPGRTSAALSMKAQIRDGQLDLGAGQRLSPDHVTGHWPVTDLAEGTPLWICAGDVAWRPRA
ncbi:ATP-binding cassette domain-containing protein [Aliiroseovarius sp. PTFE2010]|uniref:ATP-binding cassette domain-containing protein n=1 Tax=Aliiroseovarius sp. PTFE2010 TaxID=3417190 RepID=UPI003CF89EAE